MLEIFPHEYLQLGGKIREAQHLFRFEQQDFRFSETHGDIGNVMSELSKLCSTLSLPVSSTLTRNRPASDGELNIVVQALIQELRSQLFLFVPSHLAPYYEWDEVVSDEVIQAFPKASEEVRQSGTCLAAGLYTACVFHAMRAAEIGLRAMAQYQPITIKSGKPLELAEWREILDGLSNVARDIENLPNATPDKEPLLHFWSEASAQFRFFKNGWRVRVAHARASYTEPQAKEAVDHVRSFFETLAERLKE